MMRRKRFYAGLLTAAIAVSMVGNYKLPAYAQEAEKQYIIVAENEKAYAQAAIEVGDGIVAEASDLSENNILVAELTNAEADALLEENDVWMEEDIVLSGSALIDEEALRTAKAKKKTEKIRRNVESISMEEREDAPKKPEYEWNLQAVNADAAISEEESRQKAKVAVMDSGVDCVSGIDLSGYVNLVEEEQDLPEMFLDMTGHGTGIAGIIAGNGETGIYGINPKAEVYSVKVLDKENKTPLSRIIRGIYWCIENDIDIINMSFGTPVYSKALHQAVSDAYARNILMIAAAGNNGEGVEYPAAFEEVMAVAATDVQAQISDFSNTGEELDIAAPGEKIRVAAFFDGSQVTHGTSIAVPHVTGAASLLWEKDLTKSNEFIRELLLQSAKDIEGTDECGLLDVEYALASYKNFAAHYNEADNVQIKIPENTKAPENFEDINEDESYAEGRWTGTSHKGTLDGHTAGLTAEAVKIIKQGIVYPDHDTAGWHVGESKNKWWHGKWNYSEAGNTIDINYIAVFEMVTDIAIEGGGFSGLIDYTDYGIKKTVYDKVKADVKKLDYNKLGFTNTKANRKYFLYGCALHTMTDAFAHSTTTAAGNLIDHAHGADDSEHYGRRYKVAAKAVGYSIQNLKEDTFSDGYEILKAFKAVYADDTKFKMIRIKPYMKANGYTGAVLDRANIDNPK